MLNSGRPWVHVQGAFALLLGSLLAAGGCSSVRGTERLPEHPLVRKALDVVNASCVMYGRVESEVIELTRDGRERCGTRFVVTATPDPSGCLRLVSTEADLQRDDGAALPRCPPFHGRDQGRIDIPLSGYCSYLEEFETRTRVGPAGRTRWIDGRECEEFVFEVSLGRRRGYAGTACLDTAAGTPLELRYRPTPLDKDRVIETVTIRFADDGDLGWRPVSGDIEMKHDFRRDNSLWLRGRLTISEHWVPEYGDWHQCSDPALETPIGETTSAAGPS